MSARERTALRRAPALSSRGPAPSQNLRSEGSYSGFVPTFNISFTPAQQPATGTIGGDAFVH